MRISAPIDLAEVGGDLELARLTSRHVRAALAARIDSFYAYPGGFAVEAPGGLPLRLAAQKAWVTWVARLRRTLGPPAKRRGLEASATDIQKQLAWRGVLVVDGKLIPWTDWVPGSSAGLGRGSVLVPTLEMIEAV